MDCVSVCAHTCTCVGCSTLETRGNDFTSCGQLGFLSMQTMSGCGALGSKCGKGGGVIGGDKQRRSRWGKVRQAERGEVQRPQPLVKVIGLKKKKKS